MARKLEYAHLMKRLLVQDPPAGLYKEPRFWMEGKDLEGFKAHFSYGFIKEDGPIHPKEGMVVHPYDEVLVFAGLEKSNILYLGAEITAELGEEREVQVFNQAGALLIPKGMPHGPITAKRFGDKPFVHYSIGLAPEYKASIIASESLPSVSKGDKYSHLVKPFRLGLRRAKMTPEIMEKMGITAEEAKGMRGDTQVGTLGPANADQLVWLFGDNLEKMEVNFTWGFYTGCGKWHRGGEAHTHPEEEALIFVGLDPDKLDTMEAELELGMGPDYERHIFNKPTVAVCPQGFPHLPLITRWVDNTYGFMVICLSGEHDSPWVEA
jgi:hypothetical protein